jgi:hypothetical protein
MLSVILQVFHNPVAIIHLGLQVNSDVSEKSG